MHKLHGYNNIAKKRGEMKGSRLFRRLRAVSYFSLQSYHTQNLSTRAVKLLAARNEGVSPRRKNNIVVCNRAG